MMEFRRCERCLHYHQNEMLPVEKACQCMKYFGDVTITTVPDGASAVTVTSASGASFSFDTAKLKTKPHAVLGYVWR